MGRPTLHTLPPELVQVIFEALPRADLPSARLVNKTFASVAAPRLFQKIPLWISIRSLESFIELATSPHLRGYVEEIVFSPLSIKDLQESKHFAKVRLALEHETDSLNTVALRLGKYRAAYRAYNKAREYLFEDDVALKLLARALRGFPKLATLIICPQSHNIGCKELISAFGTFYPADLVGSTGILTIPILVGALAASGVKLTNLKIGSPANFLMRSKQDFYFASLKGSNAEETPNYPTPMLCLALDRAFSTSESAEKVKQAFGELRSFNIPNVPVANENLLIKSLRQISSTIKKVVSIAQHLERLEVGVIGGVLSPERSPRISLTNLTTSHSDLLYVQYLDLHGITATALEWTSFLETRAFTLVKVRFHDMLCTNEGWEIIVDELREQSWPKLEWFKMDDCQDLKTLVDDEDVSDIVVTDYLCHRTDRNPRKKPYVYYS